MLIRSDLTRYQNEEGARGIFLKVWPIQKYTKTSHISTMNRGSPRLLIYVFIIHRL